jgi:hypothetical protein
MMVLQDSLDSQKDVSGSHSETCAPSSHDGVQAVNIKVEEASDVEDEEDPVPMKFMEVKLEDEVSCMSVCALLGLSDLCPELPVLFHICIFHTELLQSGDYMNLRKVLFDMSQEDCFLLHILCVHC